MIKTFVEKIERKIRGQIAHKIASLAMMLALVFSAVPLPARAAIFAPGATLDPNCLPTDVNCGVEAPITGTAATSTFQTPIDAQSTIRITASTTPSDVADRLYNIGSVLHWNGSVVAGASGLSSLNGLSSTTQLFATGSSGTDFSISSSGNTHIFNIPTASATVRGLLSLTDWTTFNNKTESSRLINTGTGLTGGGNLTADRTLSLDINGLTEKTTALMPDTLAVYDSNTSAIRKMTRANFLQGLTSALTYQGIWNANTNSPALADGIGTAGNSYVVGTAGTQNLGSGTLAFNAGDFVIYNGTVWQLAPSGSNVASVFGRTGTITSTNGDYTATQITNTATGSISAITAQGAIDELASEKLGVSLATGLLWMGNGSGVAAAVALSGDATSASTGAVTIATNAITSGKILDGTILNADINATAAIALSKLASGTSIVTSLTTPSGTNPNGGSIASNVLTLSFADGINPGLVSTSTQTFAGNKTFSGNVVANGNTTLGDAISSDALTINSKIVAALGNGTLGQAHVIPFFYNSQTDFPVASSYHGAVAHSHADGAMYYAHGGTWVKLLDTTSGVFANNGNTLGALATLGTNDANALAFETNNVERMRIDASGNVGIGVAPSSSNKLLISGAISSITASNVGLNSGNGSVLGTAVSGTDTVIQYTTTGGSTFTPPEGVTSVQYLVLAGGGGGGAGNSGGGGGAGGFRTGTLSVTPGSSYTVTVGSGGAGGSNYGVRGSNGANSVFDTVTSNGGGGGGTSNTNLSDTLRDGLAGGSGGGSSKGTSGGTGGAGNTPATTPSQGNNGGNTPNYYGGGGGGAGAVGQSTEATPTTVYNGTGGAGASSSITGVATFYGGGGGGAPGSGSENAGFGGTGGGGRAASGASVRAATAGTNGLGGGGGGGSYTSATKLGGAGGSGVVIIRFTTITSTVASGTSSAQALLRVTDTGVATNGTLAYFENQVGGQGCIIMGETGLSCSSDIHLKKNVADAKSMLGSILALKPVTYDWRTKDELGVDSFDPYAVNDNPIGGQVGFIAQDVEKIFPRLVRLDPNGNRTLAYDRLVPIIVAAMQEQYGGLQGLAFTSGTDYATVFSSTSSLEKLAQAESGGNFISDTAGYIRERVEAGIKIARTLVAERMVAVEGYFKRVSAEKLCLTASDGALVCVTGDQLKEIGGSTPQETVPFVPSEPVVNGVERVEEESVEVEEEATAIEEVPNEAVIEEVPGEEAAIEETAEITQEAPSGAEVSEGESAEN